MPDLKVKVWSRGLSHVLIFCFLAQGAFESQLAYAQIVTALGPTQRGSGMLTGLATAMLGRSTATPLSPQLNRAMAGAQVNGQLKQALNGVPFAAQLGKAVQSSPRSSFRSAIRGASLKAHPLGRHALKPIGLHAMQSTGATVTSVATPLQPIDATAAPAADPNDPYIIAQAQALNNDANQIFAFVRDQIGTDVYQGSLRGARGALWTKAANSLDKASLLIALLGAAGIQASYAHGTLNTAQAQQTIASMFKTPSRVAGCPPPGSAFADPVNDPQLQADATDHFWVEFGPDAIPADPSFANAQLGQAFGAVVERFTSIPSNLRHKVVFRLDTEVRDSLFATLTTTEVLSYSFDTAYLVGRPVTLEHFVNAASPASLIFSTTTFQYSPFLRIPQNNPDPTLDAVLRGQDYQEIFTDFPGGTQVLTGVFLNMDVINSQGQTQTYTSTLLDRIGFAARQGGQSTGLNLSGIAPAFSPVDTMTIAAMGSSQDTAAVQQAYGSLATSFTAQQTTLQALLANVDFSNLTAQDQITLAQTTTYEENFMATLGRVNSLLLVAKSDIVQAQRAPRYGVRMYWDSPRLIAFQTKATPDPSIPQQTRFSFELNLLKDQPRVVAEPNQAKQAPFLFNLTYGITENGIEEQTGAALAAAMQAPNISPPQESADILETARSESIPLLLVNKSNVGILDTLALSADGKARIISAVESGKIVFAPASPFLINGSAVTAWYEHDPVSGYLVDVFDNGNHQDIVEYTLPNPLNKFWLGYDVGFVDYITTANFTFVAGLLQAALDPANLVDIKATVKELEKKALEAADNLTDSIEQAADFLKLEEFSKGLQFGVMAAKVVEALVFRNDPPAPPIAVDLGPSQAAVTPSPTPSVSATLVQDPLLTVPIGGAQLPLVYSAQIQNTGPSDDTFTLTFPNTPSGYSIEQSLPSVLVPSGQTGEIGFCIVPNGQIGAPGTVIPVSATVASATDPSVNASATVSISNPPVQAAVLTATPAQVTGTPGSTATAVLTVQSVGNFPVTANLAATTSTGLTLSGLTTPVTITPGASITQQLTLTVAPDAVLNQPLFATITASYGDPTAPLTSDSPASITFLVVDANALTAVNGSTAAANAGRTDIAILLGQLAPAITSLAANPGSTTIQAQVLTLIDALTAALNSPCLAAVTPALTSARAQIAAADATTMPAALSALSAALASLAAALASPCEFPFEFSLIPNVAIAQPNVPATFKLLLQNKSLVPVTYDLSLSALPAGVSGGLNTTSVTLQPGQFVPIGDANDPAVTLTQSNDITSIQFTVSAAVDGIANSTKTTEGTLTARSQIIYVQQVTPDPPFISPGATTSVTASIANAVNQTLNVNVQLAVVNSSGVTVLNVPPQSAQLNTQSLLTNVNFGTIATQSLPAGSYTLQVRVTDATTGQPIPGGAGGGVLVIGSPLTATLTVAPQIVPPGNSTVTTTLSVNGGGASISNPLVLLGTQPTASPADSIALNGNLAYVCDNNEVTIMDVTNPAQATTLGTALSTLIDNTGDIHCSVQRNALVAFSSPLNTTINRKFAISTFDLTNPEQPTLIAATPTQQQFFQSPVYIGNLAFVPDAFFTFFFGVIWIDTSGDLVSYDLSNFANPTVLGSLRGTQATTPIFGATQVNSNTLYIGGGTGTGSTNGVGRMQVVDISNPAAMAVVDEVQLSGSALFNAPLIQGNVAVGVGVTGGFNGVFAPADGNHLFGNIVVATFDITNPRTPTIISKVITPFLSGPGGGAAQIGPNLFLFGGVKDTAGHSVLLLVDISNPSAPAFRTFPIVAPISDMVASGTTLYTASGSAGFAAYLIPGTGVSNFTAEVQVPKGTGVVYDPASFSTQPVITPGNTSDTLTWANPPQNNITWNSSLTAMHTGEVRDVALGGTVSFNGPAGPGSISLPPVSVAANQILEITPATANIPAGTAQTYMLTVHNPTNANVTYDLAVTGISPAWVTLAPTVSVAAQGQTTLPLIIQTEPTATPANYGFVVTASIDSFTWGSVQAGFVLSGPGSPGPGPTGSSNANGILTVLTPTTATAGQGDTATFTLQLTNTGNVTDTYTVSAAVPAGITASFDRSSLTVQPGPSSAQQVQLRLTVTPGTPASVSSFTVTATSQTVTTVTSQQVGTLNISSSGVSITLNPTSTTPGGTLQATVTNLGSVPDTFDLSLNGPAALITTPSQNAVALDPGASQSVTLAVGPAPFATLGVLPLNAVATSQAVPAVSANASGIVTIPAILGVSASFDPASQLLPAPGQATFLLNVQNTGTVEDGYSATITGTTGPLTAFMTGLDGQPTQSIAQFRLPALSTGIIVVRATATAFGVGTVTVKIASLTDGSVSATSTATLRTPTPPTTNAGPDRTVTVGLSTRLDGSASADTNTPPLPLTYQWTLISKPQGSSLSDAAIRLASSVRGSFTPDVIGAYVLQLAVTNIAGTSTATVSYQAQDAAPVANAGQPQNVKTGAIVTLDGRGSFDPDGSPIIYVWQFASVPPQSTITNADLYDALTPSPFFRPDVDGTYHLRLTVSDSLLTSAPDFVDVTAYSGNVAPNANAGEDQFAAPLSVVTLDGSRSSDPDNGPQPLTFAWAFQNTPEGSALTDGSISGSDSAHPQFIPDLVGDYALSLSVSDGQLSSTSSVVVHVDSVNLPPIADAGPSQQILLGGTSTLDGSHSSDPDNGPGSLSLAWHLSSVAPNSGLVSSNIIDPYTAHPELTPDQPGNYVLRLAANDGLDESYANTLIAASLVCDADHDGYITENDLDLIQAALGSQLKAFDSRDFDGDGFITPADVTGCSALVPATTLSVFPRMLSFYADRTLTLVLTTTSRSLNYTVTANQPWISVTPTSATVSSNPVVLVTVNPAGLSFGTYEGAVFITPSTGGPVTVPVMMNVPMSGVPLNTGDACVYALNQSAAGAFQLIGSLSVSLACGIVSDSGSSSSLSFIGSGSLTATDINLVGGFVASSEATISPTPAIFAPFQPDPLGFLVPLNRSVCDQRNFAVRDTAVVTLNPGTYCNGITISGSPTVTFNPGVYVLLGGGLNISGSSVVTGSGVTFFLTQGLGYKYGPLSVGGSVLMKLTAPSDGPLEGILFFQDPRIGFGKQGSTIVGSVTSTIEGVLYFPTTNVQYSGAESGSEGKFLIIVADTITLNGSMVINNDFSGLAHGSPLKNGSR